MPFLYTEQKDDYLMLGRYKVAISEAYCDYLESTLDSSFMEDVQDTTDKPKKENGFVNFLKRIVAAIKRLISDMGEMFHNMFHPKDNQDLEKALENDPTKFNPGCDLDQMVQQETRTVKEGNRLIRAISNGTGVPEETINKYLKTGLKVAAGAAIPAITAFLGVKKYKSFMNKQKELSDDTENAANAASNANLTPENQSLITKISNKISSSIGSAMQYGNAFRNNMANTTIKKQNEEEKNNKKQVKIDAKNQKIADKKARADAKLANKQAKIDARNQKRLNKENQKSEKKSGLFNKNKQSKPEDNVYDATNL